jgi:hypothetical protein
MSKSEQAAPTKTSTEAPKLPRYQRRPSSRPVSVIFGPISGGDYHELVVDGHAVPYVRLTDVTAAWHVEPPSEDVAAWADEGFRLQKAAVERGERIFHLVVDNRFGLTATESEIENWAWFLANAMAVAGGYTSHGEGSRPINRHGPSRL